MLKEVTHKDGRMNPRVFVTCGLDGKPYGFDKKGLRTTIWAREVTCPECKKHPGVSGPPGFVWSESP
jgi:hypothetical protein